MKSVPRLMNIQAILEHRFQKIVLQKQFWNTASKKQPSEEFLESRALQRLRRS